MLKKLKLLPLWVYELFRPCPFPKNIRRSDDLFLITGHRGSPTKEIENTIPSFEKALDEGANSLEIDLCLTKDNNVIIWHDWDPNSTKALLREAGFEPWVKYKPHPPEIFSEFRKPIDELTLKEFREHFDYTERNGVSHPANAEIPLLKDFFTWGAKLTKLKYVNFDIKTPVDKKEKAVLILNEIKDLIKDYNPVFKIIIETTEVEILKSMKKQYPDFDYCLDIEPPPGFILEPSDYSSINAALKYNNKNALTFRPRKITFANFTTFRRIVRYDVKRKFNLMENQNYNIEKLLCGTINKKLEMKCILRFGVDGIQTDFPDRLRKYAERYKRRVE